MSSHFFTVCSRLGQGRNEGVAQFPGRRITTWGPIQCGGRRLTGGAEKFQHCHKSFLQYSAFPSERLQVRTWGRQTCFLPRAPSHLGTPLVLVTGMATKNKLIF